jgi:hypothetical protein
MKLSQILKYSGIIVGGIAAIILILSVLDLLMMQKPLLFIVAAGALSWFVGSWLKKQGK